MLDWPDLHPMLVHFPVALLSVAPLVFGVGVLKKRPSVSGTGLALVVLGTAFLLLAFESGEAGKGRVPLGDSVQAELHEHEEHAEMARLGFLVLAGLLGALQFARTRLRRFGTVIQVAAVVVYGFGLTNVLAAAHHGGRLVHVHGVHVDMTK